MRHSAASLEGFVSPKNASVRWIFSPFVALPLQTDSLCSFLPRPINWLFATGSGHIAKNRRTAFWPVSWFSSDIRMMNRNDQAYCFRFYSLPPSDRTQAFSSLGLDIDPGGLHLEVVRDVADHGRNMRRHLRRLRNDGCIDVHHPVATLFQQSMHIPQQYTAVDIPVTRIGIRKMPSDI